MAKVELVSNVIVSCCHLRTCHDISVGMRLLPKYWHANGKLQSGTFRPTILQTPEQFALLLGGSEFSCANPNGPPVQVAQQKEGLYETYVHTNCTYSTITSSVCD